MTRIKNLNYGSCNELVKAAKDSSVSSSARPPLYTIQGAMHAPLLSRLPSSFPSPGLYGSSPIVKLWETHIYRFVGRHR